MAIDTRASNKHLSLFRRLTGLRRGHKTGLDKRSRLRRLLNEQLEPRQLLAIDIHGDTLATAMSMDLQENQVTEIQASIGDGDYGAKDVDLFKVHLLAGQTLNIDIDAQYEDDGFSLSWLDSSLRVFNAAGAELAANSDATAPNDSTGYGGYGGTGPLRDSYLPFHALTEGDYYVGVSGETSGSNGESSSNQTYDPIVANSGTASSTGAYKLQLLANTPPELSISVADASGNEEDGSIAFVVSLSHAASQTVTVDYATSNDTASAPGDYTSASGPLSFSPGELTKTIVVPIVDDTVIDEGDDEQFHLDLSNVVGALLADGAALGTIANNDFPVGDLPGDHLSAAMPVTLTPNQMFETSESIGNGVYGTKDVDLYRVHLATGQTIQVDIDAGYTDAGVVLSSLDSFLRIFDSSGVELATNSKGKAANDYSYGWYSSSSDAFLKFQAPTAGDYFVGVSGESSSYYSWNSSGNRTYNPNMPDSGSVSATGDYQLQLLVDSPPTPEFSIQSVDVLEDTESVSILVTLWPESDSSASVDFSTVDKTALADVDYTAVSGTLNFAPGETSKTISVNLINDSDSDPNETFQVLLSNEVGAQLSEAVSSVTIEDDDPDAAGDRIIEAQTISLVPETQTEIDAVIGDGLYGTKDVDLYRVHLATGQTIQVDIDAGYTDAGVVLSSLDSFLRIFDSSGVELATNSKGKAANDYSYGWYGSSSDAFLKFQAPAAGDYFIGVSGESSSYYSWSASGNRAYNPNMPNSGIASATGDYQLQLLVDTPPKPKFSIESVTVLENAGAASISVTLWPESDSSASVDFSTIDETALAGVDYTAVSGTLSFAAGETSKTIAVPLLDGNVSELDEAFQVLLSNVVGVELAESVSSVTIEDDDPDAAGDRIIDAQTISLVPEAQSEIDAIIGDGLYRTNDVDFYKVQLAAGQELSIDLDARFADDGTVLSSLDGRIRVFNSTGQALTQGNLHRIGRGTSSNDFIDSTGASNNYSDDFLVFTPELPGEYYIGISAESNGSYRASVGGSGYAATGVNLTGAYRLQLIAAIAPVPTLHVESQEIREEDGATSILVRLDYPSTETITVDYAALAGTATSPGDFSLVSGNLTFPAGTVDQSIPINLVDDAVLEGYERFQLVLSDSVNAPIYETTTEFEIADNEPTPIEHVRLVRDTGKDRKDLRTVHPQLEGSVEGSLGSGDARVEFDHNEDGIVDGTVSLTASPSNFVYDPRISDAALIDFVGAVPMRFRYALNGSNGALIETTWEDYPYVLEAVPASAYAVTQLSHSAGQTDDSVPGPTVSYGMEISGHVNAYETYYGYSSGYENGATSSGCGGVMGPYPDGGAGTGQPNGGFGSPNLRSGCGTSADPESVEGTDPPALPVAIPVEFDLDQDGEVDVTTSTNTDQDFAKFFASFDNGYHTIQARALEWNEDFGMYLTGAWKAHTFYWENASAPAIDSLELLHDTGYSESDQNTNDPRIVGTIQQPFHNTTNVGVEYDLNSDGIVDGQTTIDDGVAFQFTPTGLAAGSQTIRVRTTATDNDASAVMKGVWKSIGFYYRPIQQPEIQGLSLLVDDGSSNWDQSTTNTTFIGSVTPTDGDDLTLHFDFDQDGVADRMITPQADGQFLYNALELQPGRHTINVWASRFSDIFEQTETGPTQSFSFTLVAKSQSPIGLADLALVADTGIDTSDFVTSNSAIKGRLIADGRVSRQTVEIDVDADGVVDGTTRTDAVGNFQFSPVGLALGHHAIAARGVLYNYANATLSAGTWESISFSLVASTNEATVISEFGLVNDSGTPGDDISEDIRLSGRVLNDASAAGVAVELDLDGDGISDQTVFSGQDGRFLVEPPFSLYGPVTVAARAVEFDTEAKATIAGLWTSHSFVFENQTDSDPVSSELLFVSGDVANGDLPSLAGKVRYQHSNAGLRVEIDANGDGAADYATTTDAYGQFQIHLPHLANHSTSIAVRSIANNSASKVIQSEAWQTLPIHYVIADSAAATVDNISLAEDTGSSSTDRVTTNPKIVGEVSRRPTGRIMIVEVDTDGDHGADGSTIVASDLTWAYSPANLAVGSVQISARTRDTAVDGQTVFGQWANFTFTLESGVDPGGSSEEQDQQGAIDEANNQADADRNAADGDLSDDVASANQPQDASVNAAESQFKADSAQAANVFAQAQATASANYQAALSAFAGNNTTFKFDPLDLPDSPQFDRYSILDDGAQPQPPREQPNYQGPAFDFEASGTYLAATNEAKSTFDNAISSANRARRAQDVDAQQAYRTAQRAVWQSYRIARQPIYDAYRAAINAPASTDLAAVRDAYNNAMQSATDTYRSTIDSADTGRSAALESAASSKQSNDESIRSSYESASTAAQNARTAALTGSPSLSVRDAAWSTYSSAILSAGKVRGQASADNQYAYSAATIDANASWHRAVADARQTLALTQNAAARTYDDAIANRANQLREIKIAATITREKALLTSFRDRTKSEADAAKVRDQQLAINAKTEQLAIAQAESTLWVAEASAKKSALVAWNAAVATPWTAYQVELAKNELTYFQSLSTTHNTHSQSIANAKKVHADAVADAAHQRANQTADEDHTFRQGYADAKSLYWTDGASKLLNAMIDSNTQRQSIRDDLANISLARAHQNVDAGEAYALTVSEVDRTYATTMISARTNKGVPRTTAISAGATAAIGRKNAARTLALANVANSQTWSTDYRNAWNTFSDYIQAASTTESIELAGDLKQYHETSAPLHRNYAIATAEIEGDESQAVAAASVIYVQTIASADQAYEIASVQYVGIREIGDANDLKSYRSAEAASYANQMNAWHGAVNSPWSARHVNQGLIEIAWANATGSAEIAFAAEMKTANLARETTQADAKRMRRVSIANADQTQTNSMADQNEIYVGAVAAAKYTYAMTLAGITRSKTEERHNDNTDVKADSRAWSNLHFSGSAANESAYQIAMINANADYANASTSALAAYRTATAISNETYLNELSTEGGYYLHTAAWATHQSNVDNARDTYNSEMSTVTGAYNTSRNDAWDALRDTRAESLGRYNANSVSHTLSYNFWQSDASKSFLADKGNAEKLLADSILAAETNLANGSGAIEKAYVNTIAPLDAAYEVTLRQSDNAHGYASTIASTISNREAFIADAARRENQIAARGIDETASYQAFATLKTAIASANPNPRTLSEAKAAAADALWADAVRIARDSYEDAISIAGLARINTLNAADVVRTGSLNTATNNYTNSVAWAESAYQISTAHASTDLSVIDAIAQGTLAQQEIYARVDYDNQAADAKILLGQELGELSGNHADDVSNAYQQYYLESAGEWTGDITWNNVARSYYGSYSGGFYNGYVNYFNYYSYNYGYGYDGYDGYGYGYNAYGYGGSGYGLGNWGGWGLGYYWGHGFANHGGRWSDNYSDLQDTLETGTEVFDSAAVEAHASYANVIGDADIDRATTLGDAQLALADARGTGGVAYAVAISLAESNRSTISLAADASQAAAIAGANKIHADALATANRDNTIAAETALVGLVNLEQTAGVILEGNLATAASSFHVATANSQAAFASAVANGSANPHVIYAATYAQAKANWIADVAPAQVTHATAVATADGQAAYDIALARANRNSAKANADKTFADVQSSQVKARALDEIVPTRRQHSDILALRNARRLSAANHTKDHEHTTASAERALGIDIAQASKQREIDRASKVESATYEDTYRAALGDGTLTYETAIADANLTWQQAEANAQLSFTNSSIPIKHTFSTTIIGLDQAYSVAIATAEQLRQSTRATAEGIFFNTKNTANNTKRSSTATAVIGLWNVQESARVGAHTDVNDALQIPWSQYLVDAATARATWWNSVSAQYANLAGDQNAAETTYTARLATAHVIRQQAIAAATKNKSLVEANTQAAEAIARADAVRDYFTAMVTPTKVYVDSLAQAEQQQSLDTARANRDYIDHESSTQQTAELDAAKDTFSNSKDTLNSTYRSLLASEQADQYARFATAEFNRTVALIAADISLVTTRNNAEKTYRNEGSEAYLQSATTWANIDAFYRQGEADTFAMAASALASMTGTPWATYDANFYAAQANMVTAVSNAAKANAIAQATAQKAAESGQTNAETTWLNAYATASSVVNTGIASAHLGFATAQSLIYSAMGGSDLPLPTLSHPSDFNGQYTVSGPSLTHRTSLASYTNNQHSSLWGGYWWGAWGNYHSGPWYGSYGGNSSYLYGTQASSAARVSLRTPSWQFNYLFWQIDAPAANDPWEAWAVEYRYRDSNGDALVAQVELPEGSFSRLPTVDTKVSTGLKAVNAEVIELMQELGDTAGDLWTLLGSINLAPIAKRISSSLVELAPELNQHALQQEGESYTETPTFDTSLATGALSIAPATDQSSYELALQLFSQRDELSDAGDSLTPAELGKAKQIAVQTFAQQMILNAVENSSAEIVQVILDRYQDNADLQNALIMMLQNYKVVTADAWWNDYWIDHKKQIVYVSDANNFYTRNAESIVGELEGAIRDDDQFYQMFGLDESWEGFSGRMGFALLETVGGGFAIVGGAVLFVVPEPTMLTKAGGGLAVSLGVNSAVAGISSFGGRDSRVDIVGSGLEAYYDATGVDEDLRSWGHGGLLVANVASGFAGGAVNYGTIRSFLVTSKAFVQQSLKRFQNILHSGKSIREVAKISNVKALIKRAKASAAPRRTVTNSVTRSVDDANAPFIAKGWNPPYSGKFVREFATGQETVFVRVHGTGNKARSWMMRADEVKGLTPAQIKDKFALPHLPTHISEVHVPAGTRIRVGKVAPQEGWGAGGAWQYELLERLPEEVFKNTRPL